MRLSEPLQLDGRLDEQVYESVQPIGGFIQAVPDVGQPPTGATDVWVTSKRWLLCERSATDERNYLLHLPATTSLVDLVALEQQYRELKDELGLDHFEERTYPGWTHHVVLTAVAFTFLQIEQGHATVAPRPTLPVVRGWSAKSWACST